MIAPHLIFYAGADAKTKLSADESLDRLVALADDLQLDLVIDVRTAADERLTWSVRFSLPGAAVGEKPSVRFSSLHRALRETSAEAALDWLRRRSASAPARWLDPSSAGRAEPMTEPSLTWAEISGRLTPLAVGAVGAMAVHRQGEWYCSAVEPALEPASEVAPDPVATAENSRRLHLVPPLPEPVGALIPTSTCSKCRGDRTTHCYRCAGEGQVLEGLALTVTDLAGRTKHVNWSPEAELADHEPDTSDRAPVSGIPLRRKEILIGRHFSVGSKPDRSVCRPICCATTAVPLYSISS